MNREIKCSTQAEVDAAIAADDVPVLSANARISACASRQCRPPTFVASDVSPPRRRSTCTIGSTFPDALRGNTRSKTFGFYARTATRRTTASSHRPARLSARAREAIRSAEAQLVARAEQLQQQRAGEAPRTPVEQEIDRVQAAIPSAATAGDNAKVNELLLRGIELNRRRLGMVA